MYITMYSILADIAHACPQDWWQSGDVKVFTWGKGGNNQLGHSTNDKTRPGIVPQWSDCTQVLYV